MSDFDYGGSVAETVSNFKNPTVGARNARLYGLIRVGTFRETFKKEVKAPAPQAIAIFHLLGKADKLDDGSPMFFNKTFPLKKGDKSFMHKSFIPAFGGFAKHSGFGSMINCMVSLKLKGGKELNDEGAPKYVNFDSVSEIAEETLELLMAAPQYAALENPIGFLKEDELTAEVLKSLHPTREFAGIVMQTEEFKAGTHPCQALIQSIYDEDPERYTRKESDKSDEEDDDAGNQSTNKPQAMPTEQLADEGQEF